MSGGFHYCHKKWLDGFHLELLFKLINGGLKFGVGVNHIVYRLYGMDNRAVIAASEVIANGF